MTGKPLLKIAAFVFCTLLACFALTINSEATTTVTNLSPSFGTVGTTVTIYGTNFGTSTGTVTFYNGKSATVSSWNGTTNEIKVTVPTGATTGVVTVTPSGGTGVTSTADFNVLATKGMLALGAFPPSSASCTISLPGYTGSNCIGDYQTDVITNGGADGVVIAMQWSSIDLGDSAGTGPGCPTSGASSSTCTWSVLDNLVNNYVGWSGWTKNKKVGIVLAPVTDGNSNSGTPAYVFTPTWATTAGGSALDECTCSSWTGDSGAPQNQCWNQSNGGSTDTSGMPAVWEAPFYVALEDFYDAAVAHFNSHATYSPYIAYVRMGLSGGGEEYPFCASNLETLSSVSGHDDSGLETVWTGYANTMSGYVGSTLASQVPLMAAPNGNASTAPAYSWADAEASDAVADHLNLGSEGLQSADTFDTSCSSSGGSSNDWCYTFQTDAPPIRELQTLQYSDSSESTCTTNYYSHSNSSTQNTGSLVCLLPFVEGKGNVVELYPEDMFAAFDSSNYTGYVSTYAGAINNAQAGH
jgi:hypothetical protein